MNTLARRAREQACRIKNPRALFLVHQHHGGGGSVTCGDVDGGLEFVGGSGAFPGAPSGLRVGRGARRGELGIGERLQIGDGHVILQATEKRVVGVRGWRTQLSVVAPG
jgi:hypothetical protein